MSFGQAIFEGTAIRPEYALVALIAAAVLWRLLSFQR
jgi:hypothetical protein